MSSPKLLFLCYFVFAALLIPVLQCFANSYSGLRCPVISSALTYPPKHFYSSSSINTSCSASNAQINDDNRGKCGWIPSPNDESAFWEFSTLKQGYPIKLSAIQVDGIVKDNLLLIDIMPSDRNRFIVLPEFDLSKLNISTRRYDLVDVIEIDSIRVYTSSFIEGGGMRIELFQPCDLLEDFSGSAAGFVISNGYYLNSSVIVVGRLERPPAASFEIGSNYTYSFIQTIAATPSDRSFWTTDEISGALSVRNFNWTMSFAGHTYFSMPIRITANETKTIVFYISARYENIEGSSEAQIYCATQDDQIGTVVKLTGTMKTYKTFSPLSGGTNRVYIIAQNIVNTTVTIDSILAVVDYNKTCDGGYYSILGKCLPCVSDALYSPGGRSASCSPKQDCIPGTMVALEATSSSDRVCKECVLNLNFANASNQDKCQSVTFCGPDQIVIQPASLVRDTVCGAPVPPLTTGGILTTATTAPRFTWNSSSSSTTATTTESPVTNRTQGGDKGGEMSLTIIVIIVVSIVGLWGIVCVVCILWSRGSCKSYTRPVPSVQFFPDAAPYANLTRTRTRSDPHYETIAYADAIHVNDHVVYDEAGTPGGLGVASIRREHRGEFRSIVLNPVYSTSTPDYEVPITPSEGDSTYLEVCTNFD